MIAILIILVFIFISTSIIGICSIYINTHSSDCENVNTNLDCPTLTTCTTIEKTCYCNKNVFAALNDAKINTYCGDDIKNYYISQGIQYAVVATSGITNYLFGFIIDKIINFTRPSTYS